MYVGEWKYGYHHGQGTLFVIVIGSEFKVEGIFKNGSPWNCKNYLLNGNYIGKYVNVEWVEEDVEEDNEQKWGVLFHNNWGWFVSGDTDKDGKYLGEIENGKPNGQGTLTYSNGNKYVGEWKYWKRNGQGTWTSPDGHEYVGEFKDGERNGQGTWTSPNGKKYVGEYKDGQYWEGIMYDKNGNILMKFVNGVLQK